MFRGCSVSVPGCSGPVPGFTHIPNSLRGRRRLDFKVINFLILEFVHAQRAYIALWMHAGGLESYLRHSRGQL